MGRIVAAEAWLGALPLEEPYSVAYGSADTAKNVFLRLETDDGLVGYGCTAPDPDVTGETAESALEDLRRIVEPLVRGEDAAGISRLLECVSRALPTHRPGPVMALDLALHDLLGKRVGLPLWKLLGAYRDRIETSITIGILPERQSVERALAWVKRGFFCLKLKGGHSWGEDAARIKKVREAVGSSVRIRFDANQGFTVADAVAFAVSVADCDLELVEQPTAADRPSELAEVQRRIGIPVMADESLLDDKQALALAASRSCPLFNVKLAKCGGIRGALDILSIAGAADIGAMVGCMDDSALGIAAGLHVALSSPQVRYADLDGHIGLIGDPFDGAVTVADGLLIPREEPGLGAKPRD